MMTYGDGVHDLNIKELLSFHIKTGKTATVTCVLFEQNKGVLNINGNLITSFREKSIYDSSRVKVIQAL